MKFVFADTSPLKANTLRHFLGQIMATYPGDQLVLVVLAEVNAGSSPEVLSAAESCMPNVNDFHQERELGNFQSQERNVLVEMEANVIRTHLGLYRK